MTLVASIIKSALRETNLIPLGVEPTDDQSDEAFGLLSTIVAGVLGNEAGENMVPMPLGQNEINSPAGYPWWSNELPGNMFVPTNTRIMCNLTAAGNVNFSPRPHDGARMGVVDVSQNFDVNNFTIFGNGRSIEGDDQQTYTTAGLVREWIYREDLGNWVTVIPLDPAGSMPWPAEFDDVFIIMLAMRLNPRFGQVMHPHPWKPLKLGCLNSLLDISSRIVNNPPKMVLLYLTNYYRFLWSLRQ
jgi:hypothetical protein